MTKCKNIPKLLLIPPKKRGQEQFSGKNALGARQKSGNPPNFLWCNRGAKAKRKIANH